MVKFNLKIRIYPHFELVRSITHYPFQLGSPKMDQRRKIAWLRSLSFWMAIDLDLQGEIWFKKSNFLVSPLLEIHNHHITTAWCQRTGNWSDRITVPQWVLSEVHLQHLLSVGTSSAVLQGLPLAAREKDVASQRSCHINVLEIQAIINAVRTFRPHLRFRVVRLICDNAVTLAYIKNLGGTRSYTLMQLMLRLLKWCIHKAITLVSVHLPGVHNIQTDSLSRVSQTLNT